MKKIYLPPIIILTVAALIKQSGLHNKVLWANYVLVGLIITSIILNIIYLVMFYNHPSYGHYLIVGLVTLGFIAALLANNSHYSIAKYPFSLKDSLAYIISVLTQGNLFAFLGAIFLYLATKYAIQDSPLYLSLNIVKFKFFFDVGLFIIVLILIMHMIISAPSTGRSHHYLIPSF